MIAEGGYLLAPTGLAVGPSGSILVADARRATINPVPNVLSQGALVRVDPTSGAQTLIAASSLYQAPQDVAYVGGDSAWVVNRGISLHDAGGAMIATRLSDGASGQAPVAWSDSKGVAMLPNGRIVYSACLLMNGPYCYSPYVALYGSDIGLSDYMGDLAVVPNRALPTMTGLAPAMPNPFGASTTLGFNLAKTGTAELAIYSVDGRRLAMLESGTLAAGTYKLTWGGTDDGGRRLAPGVYYARLRSADGRFTRPLVLIR